MKKLLRTSLFLVIVAITATSCGVKETNTKSVATSNPSTSTNGYEQDETLNGRDPVAIAGCNGVYRSGASRCYYSELPKILFSGLPTTTPVNTVSIWSSASLVTALPSFSPNNFVTDGSFSVRFKPSVATAGVSQQGKVCSSPMGYNVKRVKLHLMLRRQGDSISSIYETTAKIDDYSSKIYLPVISGTSAPYILEVMGIETDHRCNAYGNLSTNEKAACAAGTYWGTIPLVTSNNPTSCVAVKLEFATDETYDLP